jgi:hypothetical protein
VRELRVSMKRSWLTKSLDHPAQQDLRIFSFFI